MRFVGLFLSLLLLAVMLVFVGWWGWDIARVWWAGQALRSDFLEVKRLANQEQDLYSTECGESVLDEGSREKKLLRPVVSGYRLRFLDTTHYLIEAVCANQNNGPFSIRSERLRMNVKKIYGSGVFAPVVDERLPESPKKHQLEARVLIGMGKAYRVVGLADDVTVNKNGNEQFTNIGADSTVTECAGWGYGCCNQATQVGQGKPELRTLDCPQQCYPVCLERPSVVFFNTDPPIDGGTRVVELSGADVSVRFGYELVDFDGDVRGAKIDFGDGKEEALDTTKGVAAHIYHCGSVVCDYVARITLTDDMGLPMVDSRIASLTVRITP